LLIAGQRDVIDVPAELQLMVAAAAREVAERLRDLIPLALLIGPAAERRAGLQKAGAKEKEQRLRPLALLQIGPELAAHVTGGRLEKRLFQERCLADDHAGRGLGARRRRARERDGAGD